MAPFAVGVGRSYSSGPVLMSDFRPAPLLRLVWRAFSLCTSVSEGFIRLEMGTAYGFCLRSFLCRSGIGIEVKSWCASLLAFIYKDILSVLCREVGVGIACCFNCDLLLGLAFE